MSAGSILVVEDEPEVADLLTYNLRRADFQVRSSSDGLSACRAVAEGCPDLILLDILLPDLEGWEVCRLIRGHRDPDVASTPIALLTARGSLDDRLRGLELGADDYITKPFSVREVVARCHGLVRRRRDSVAVRKRLATLEKRDRLHTDLQRSLFHELKNKLVVIGGFATRLADGTGRQAGADTAGFAEAIRSNASYLQTLAEEFLVLKKIESDSLSLPGERVALATLTREVLALHERPARSRDVRLVDTPNGATGEVLAHATALRLCLSNLVENAVRYSPPGSTVQLQVGASGDGVWVEVRDDGPGIPERERQQVFKCFYRGSAGREAGAGSGLGLYLVETLVAAMGGTVVLSCGPAPGTTVRLRLPSAPRPDAGGAGHGSALRRSGTA